METVEQIRNFVGMLFPNEPIGLQRILEKKSVSSSIDEMMAFVTEQSIKLKVSTNASKSLMSNYIENHKRAYYKKMIDEINKEIGDAKPDNKYVSGITEKMPENVRDVIKEEIEKLKMVGQSHAESESIRNYLDWMIAIPWGKYSEDNLNLAKAKKVMEEDHYGLKDVKDRIIEFIATAILRKSVAKGKILCFVGPPGVGKTSMGRSIARALNRSFVMLSVGGMTDQHEIKGHRRTYVSAMPGKVARLLKQAKTANPLIMIDEIDKIGHNSYRSNVSATLLELLDTNQNHEFMDNFMDVPLDLSKALFVCTANDGSAIEPVLADRMEFITLSGYTHQEKRCIAERYLIPKVLSDTGILLKQCSVTNEALDYILRWHCREAGVRNLDRALQKIFRKVAVKLVKEGDKANDG
ncbi:Lon protease mitochondrial, partial [Bonamia ostreae]